MRNIFIPIKIMGISGYPLRIAATVTAWIVPMVLQKVGYVAGQPATAEVANGIMNIYSVWGTAFVALAFLIITLFYKLTNTKLEEIQKTLDERAAAEAAE